MPVIIDQVSTDVTVDPMPGTTSRGSTTTETASPDARADDLRAMIREILREELERAMRLGISLR